MPRPARIAFSARLITIMLAVVGGALLAAAPAAGQSDPAIRPDLAKLQWRSVGPYVGGRVVAIAGVPSQPDLFYMGAVDGGIWKSTNYGLTWKNISDGTLPGSSTSIGALAVAPSNPKVIYAGTGEADIRGDMITGDGVFRSADGGKTWHAAGLADTHTTMALVVDPRDANVVYAASMGHVFVPGPNRGVFKTTDGGKTWKKALFVNDSTGAVDLVMDPKNPDVLYAATWQAYRKHYRLSSGGEGSGIYKSTDGGAHWTNISRNQGLPRALLGKIGVAVAPSSPNIVYATIQAKDGGVFRSSDAGQTWTRVNDEWKLRQRAFYYMAITVDPQDTNTVYMPQVDAVYTSHDGAKTFKRMRTPHGDNHIIWVNPDNPKIMLEGNDGGATVSTDGGKTWSTEHNQPTGQFYHVNLDDQFPFHIYGAQQDEGATEGPSASDNGAIGLGEWQNAAYGESTFSVPQPGDPDITYGSGYFSIFLKNNLKTGQLQSVSPWPYYQEGTSSGELKYRFAWTHPILFSPADSSELLIGSQYVMKSDDYGQTWQTISPDLTRDDSATEAPTGGPIDLDQSGAEIYATVSAIGVAPTDGQVIWAGSDDGLVHVTRNGGGSWTNVTPPDLPKWTYISCIEPDHDDPGTAYLAARRYMWDDFSPFVFKTTDYGAHWTAMTDGLPADQYVFAVRQDPNDPDLLFLGTKNTVYVSFNGGAHWQPLALNLPKVQVRDVRIDTRQGDVVVATHGRAFWVLDNLALLEHATKQPAPAGSAVALFAPERAWLSHAYGGSSYPVPDAGKNPPFGATVFFQVPQSYDGTTPVKLSFADAQGRTVRTFTLHLKKKLSAADSAREANETNPVKRKADRERKLTAIEPGMNRFQWDLRYSDAAEVTGFEPPVAAGGLTDEVSGPVVTPGTYTVTLDYGGQTGRQSFDIALDPRIHATSDDLAARLGLQLQIHAALDTLDTALNHAIAMRDSLTSLEGRAARGAQRRITALNDAINGLVQLDLHSSEGSLLHETKLRSHIAYLAADIDLAYARPTQAQYAVFEALAKEAHEGEASLKAAMRR
jgi:photosystem II stability/assembly factor-like uncharacterized protein